MPQKKHPRRKAGPRAPGSTNRPARSRRAAASVGKRHPVHAQPHLTKKAARSENKKGIGRSFEALVALQARLRAPGGCPWDREQTNASLRTYLVEETYEVLDALDSGDPRKFAGELGDVLLQVVFHAELAAEAGRFDIGDVIEHVHSKMVRRHPHVFGTVQARTSAQVLKNWEQLKTEERRAEELRTADASRQSLSLPSVLDSVPRTLPALLEAYQLTRKAARVGFDWHHVDGLFDKLEEEAGELRRALDRSAAEREEEIGDLLFMGVNLARFLGLDPEIALKKANAKFAGRFRAMETLAAGRGQRLPDLAENDLEGLWSEVKARGPLASPVS